MTIQKMIDKCINLAEVDCFTEEQFAFRDFMYDVASFLNKYNKSPEYMWVCPVCGGKDYDGESLCLDCGCRMISKEVHKK